MTDTCKNCGATLGGFFRSARKITESEYLEIKNQYPNTPTEICTECSPLTKSDKLWQLASKSEEQENNLIIKKKAVERVAVSTVNILQSVPIGEFKVLGIVSAQTIKSTGILLNVGLEGMSGGFDLSNTKATKLGEEELIDLLKLAAYEKGANAIVGVDIDISDAGGFKTVLMCAQGTAVKIDKIERFFDFDD